MGERKISCNLSLPDTVKYIDPSGNFLVKCKNEKNFKKYTITISKEDISPIKKKLINAISRDITLIDKTAIKLQEHFINNLKLSVTEHNKKSKNKSEMIKNIKDADDEIGLNYYELSVLGEISPNNMRYLRKIY